MKWPSHLLEPPQLPGREDETELAASRARMMGPAGQGCSFPYPDPHAWHQPQAQRMEPGLSLLQKLC